jgi:hypothetical protein
MRKYKGIISADYGKKLLMWCSDESIDKLNVLIIQKQNRENKYSENKHIEKQMLKTPLTKGKSVYVNKGTLKDCKEFIGKRVTVWCNIRDYSFTTTGFIPQKIKGWYLYLVKIELGYD